jgi:hypothetical protein
MPENKPTANPTNEKKGSLHVKIPAILAVISGISGLLILATSEKIDDRTLSIFLGMMLICAVCGKIAGRNLTD